jgi:glycerol-3-phosphate acyltransferase PlsX
MHIGIDIMGGDFAPDATIKGAILAHDILKNNATVVLIGKEELIHGKLHEFGADSSQFEIVDAPEAVSMGEHPTKTFSKKPNSSIAIGFKLLASGKIQGFASAGNTGAMFVGAMHTIKSVPGIIRPCLTASLPKETGQNILLDVGLNPDSKPDVLYQYAILGSLYAEFVHGVSNPRVGLLNIGEEEEKGNLLTKATYMAMKDTDEFNFVGNIEGNKLFSDDADVIVCDGFVGNVILKQAEAFYTLTRKKQVDNEYFDRFNFENYGGTPILGVNAPVIIGHGISNETAIKNMVLHTVDVVKSDLTNKIKEAFQ